MKSRSSKAKGRRLQNEIRQIIIDTFKLNEDDIKVALMGESGEDIKLSTAARKVFPYSIESKNVESLNIWKAIKQARENSKGHTPIVIFRRNNEEPHVVIKLDKFLELLKNTTLNSEMQEKPSDIHSQNP